MKNTIYYFTGTGNSLKIARDIAEELGETELIPIARASEQELAPESDIVGIIFPVYAWGPPAAVMRFLDKVKLGKEAYVFSVCTCGGSASGTLLKVRKKLEARDIVLSSGFIIKMPSNYIVWGGAESEEKQAAKFAAAKDRVPEICSVIKEKKVQEIEKGGLAGRIITGLIYRLLMRSIAKQDKKFVVGDECNGCGICAKVCPVGNIELSDSKPVWLHKCEQCLACIQFCPQEAIQVGTKTTGRQRYHHPEIKVKDLMNNAEVGTRNAE
ncbi:EFR1 family ferrodoxin [Planctomycetota bacterium]